MKRVFLTEGEANVFASGVRHLCVEPPLVRKSYRSGAGGRWPSQVWEVVYRRADQLELLGIEQEGVTNGQD